MKALRNLLTLVLITLFSCEYNSMEEELLTPDTFEKTKIHQSVGQTELSEIGDEPQTVTEEFLYMISFLTTRTLLENEDARNYFKEMMINSGGDHFNIDQLLTIDAEEENAFELEFHNQFGKYNFEMVLDTVDNDSIFPTVIPPQATVHPPEDDFPDITGSVMNAGFSEFVSEISGNNCLELYFPNIQILGPEVSLEDHSTLMRATWHPLNNDSFNSGMELYADGGKYKIIGDEEVEEPVFLIVVRPENTNNCNYGPLDFTQFLSN